MMDAYAEWIVKRKMPAYGYILMPVMVILCLIAVVLALYFSVFGFIIALGIFAGTYFVFRNLRVEYEYIYVAGQLSIDKILGQSKRKRAMNCDLENIQAIGPESSNSVKDLSGGNVKIKDFTSQTGNSRVYAIIYQDGGEKTKILFEPNEKMLTCLQQAAPRKVTL